MGLLLTHRKAITQTETSRGITMNHFTQDNTEGFTDNEIELLNAAMDIVLDGSTDEDDIKNAADRVNNNYTGNGDTAESLAR